LPHDRRTTFVGLNDLQMTAEKSNEGTVTKSKIAGLITLLLVSPVYFAFAHFGHRQKGFLVTCVISVFAAILYSKGRELLNVYSISFMTIMLIAQIFCVLFYNIPVPHSFSIAVLPFAIADCVLMIAILGLMERAFGLMDTNKRGRLPTA
jgi:integral membrane sensor domain MASE1